MPVGTESLKRTAKSVAAPKNQTKAAAKQEKATKAVKKTRTTEITKTVKNDEPVYTSGIKCELPVHLL